MALARLSDEVDQVTDSVDDTACAFEARQHVTLLKPAEGSAAIRKQLLSFFP